MRRYTFFHTNIKSHLLLLIYNSGGRVGCLRHFKYDLQREHMALVTFGGLHCSIEVHIWNIFHTSPLLRSFGFFAFTSSFLFLFLLVFASSSLNWCLRNKMVNHIESYSIQKFLERKAHLDCQRLPLFHTRPKDGSQLASVCKLWSKFAPTRLGGSFLSFSCSSVEIQRRYIYSWNTRLHRVS